MGDRDGLIPVAQFVAALREELKVAQAARDPQLQFTVGPVTVEFTVVSAREGGPEGKVRFWVIEAGASAKWSHSKTQKVTLTLAPVGEHGEDVRVGDQVCQPHRASRTRDPRPGSSDRRAGVGRSASWTFPES